jgi:hypothetical protein
VRLLRQAVGLNVMIGPGIAALGIGGLFRGESPLISFSLILEGALFLILGWFRYVHGPGRERKTAIRALELNQLVAHPGA